MLATTPIGRTLLRRPRWSAIGARSLLLGLIGSGLLLVAVAGPTLAADPTPTPSASETPEAPDPTPTPPPAVDPTPAPPADPTPTPAPTPPPDPTPPPTPVVPASLDLYLGSSFQYQDPNFAACTSTSVMNMLNFVLAYGSGGPDFRWVRSKSGVKRDAILRWERNHDTLPRGVGSDPHGWRNALNYYGWGTAALLEGARVYDDVSYRSYGPAIKAAVRAVIATSKPVGLMGWQGHHAQVLTGYFGLVGDPFAKNGAGVYTDAFTVAGLYISDVLSSDRMRHIRVSYSGLQRTTNYRLRFRAFSQWDSTMDDPYSVGWVRARSEWRGRFVVILPLR